jgi:uncharacterized protein (TIGR02246 family)
MTTRSADLRAIAQMAADWRAGWLAGDVDTLLALYADDPVLLPQGQPAVTGRDAIRALYEAVLSEFQFTTESTLNEVDASGDLGYFWSTYRLTATPKGGGASTTSAGKSVFIVRRQRDGTWKITRLIDNSDNP